MTTQNNRICSHAFFNTINITNRAIRDVFQLLADGEAKLCTQRVVKDAILVLGNTGAGKSAFSRTIAGYDTTLKSIEEGLYYNIKNPYNENDGKSFITSSTIFPEQIQDNNTGTVYYDFPGFQDTRGMAHDIATTYFIKRIVDSVQRVKLLLLVNYTSLTNTGTRDDFTTVLSHIIKFVGNVDKYQGGIALIATKVHFPKHTDDQIISTIVKFIDTVKQNLEKQEDNPKATKTIKLLNILLQQDGNMYPKIAIFRSPNSEGYLSDIPILQENIAHLKTKLAKLKFVEKTDADFGYTIPKQSLLDVDKIIKEIARSFTTTVQEMGKEIERYVSAEQNQLNDIFKLDNLTSVRYDELRKIKELANNQEELEKCTLEIVNGAASMNMNLPAHGDMLMKFGNYSLFMHKVSDHAVENQFKCADGMQDVIEHMNKLKKWYHFFNKLYERLSDYDIQKNIHNNPCTALSEYVAKAIEDEKNVEFNLDPLVLKKCYPDYELIFENDRSVTADKSKLNVLKNVLNLALQNSSSYSCDSNKLVIKGINVRLGDVPDIQKRECKIPPKFIEILALNKIFINTDLDKTGEEVQLSIIAPMWDIQGSRKIILDGGTGKAHNPSQAVDGTNPGGNGADGLPGLPGGPAGNFIGIGDTFKNLQELTISVRGGDGGPGQNGGDGGVGQNGEDANNDIYLDKSFLHKLMELSHLGLSSAGSVASDHHKILKVWSTGWGHYAVLAGKPGVKGGSGGNGGVGGLGGNPGEIMFVPLTSTDTNHINKVTGMGIKGSDGKGGAGFPGGKNGNDLQVYKPTLLSAVRGIETTIITNPWEADGVRGKDGDNYFRREHPKKGEQLLNPSILIDEYKNYVKQNMNRIVGELYSLEFLQKFENIKHLLNHRRKRRYIDSKNETFNVDHVKVRHEGSHLSRNQDTNKVNPVANDSNVAKSTAVRINSPINFAVSLFGNFFGHLKIYNPANILTIGLVRGGIDYMFRESTSSYISNRAQGNTNHALALGNVNINESLTLADFAVRCFTKQKFYNSEEKTIRFSEIKAFVINIVTKFERILSDMSVQYNLPPASLEFDPVTLMSELEKEVIDRNYKKVRQVLYHSIECNLHPHDSQFCSQILHNFDNALEKQTIQLLQGINTINYSKS